jgi:aminopeptidase-like protein
VAHNYRYMKESFKEKKMITWAKDLFPYNRSLLGSGNLKTLSYLKKINKNLKILKFLSGKKVFDWIIPKEWIVKEAYFKSKKGKKYCDFKKNNLNLVQYSTSIETLLDKKNLIKKIHSIQSQPDSIPYITSYYKKNWGFCMKDKEKKKLPEGKYKVVIKTEFKKSSLVIGELFLKGRTKKEIFFSTNICHPSMANNELSGPVLSSYLYAYIAKNYKKTKYSYRFVFIPETIGSIAYIQKNLKLMKRNILCGFTLSCVGDERVYSQIKSPHGNNLADQALAASLNGKNKIKTYSYLSRGSDERQYCSPRVNLPICGFTRSKYGTYPEYHTSKDDFKVVTEKGLIGSFEVLKDVVDSFELCLYPKTKIICEPFLSKRDLMPSVRDKKMYKNKQQLIISNLIAYSDGKRSIFELSNILNIPLKETVENLRILKIKNLIT